MNQEIAKETAAEEAPKPERSPLLVNIKSLSDLDLAVSPETWADGVVGRDPAPPEGLTAWTW